MIQIFQNIGLYLLPHRARQLRGTESLRLPGYPVTAALLWKAIKQTRCIKGQCGKPKNRKHLSAHLPAASDR
jgi:hypothetical protein